MKARLASQRTNTSFSVRAGLDAVAGGKDASPKDRKRVGEEMAANRGEKLKRLAPRPWRTNMTRGRQEFLSRVVSSLYHIVLTKLLTNAI